MNNRTLGIRSTIIRHSSSLQPLTYVESDTSVCDTCLLFHAVELACDL